MPPLRRIHRTYPFDILDDIPNFGDPGIWFELSTVVDNERPSGFVGLAEVSWPTVPTNGSPNSRLVRFQNSLNAALQATCERRIPFTDIVNESTAGNTRSDDDPVSRDLQPEPFCRFEDTGRGIIPPAQESRRNDIETYVVRVVEIFVPVESINPVVIGAIEVSNAASGIQRV